MGGTCVGTSVDVVCPGFGPESGGSDVFVWGRGFTSSVKKVYLWPFECNVIFRYKILQKYKEFAL